MSGQKLEFSCQDKVHPDILIELEKEDIIIPTHCPVLGIELKLSELSKNGGAPYSYSLDRINPELGYIKGNVMVMSHLANSMKNNATKEQLISFSNWVRKNYE